jgi:hypothetical protein
MLYVYIFFFGDWVRGRDCGQPAKCSWEEVNVGGGAWLTPTKNWGRMAHCEREKAWDERRRIGVSGR